MEFFLSAQIMVLNVWFRLIEYMDTRLLKLTHYSLKSLQLTMFLR